jgi:F420-non-reducing hydrogenase iron-sulfur subunit
MVHPNLVIDALTKGVDGVLMCGCHIGDCHYIDGNKYAEKRADSVSIMLEDFGIEPERFRLEWISASEAPKFAQVMTDMVDTIKKLGPSPYSQ